MSTKQHQVNLSLYLPVTIETELHTDILIDEDDIEESLEGINVDF